MSDESERKKAKLTAPKKLVHHQWNKGLSTGSTLLNLAMTGRPGIGYLPGHYYWYVGDSESGKSWVAMTAFAEAARNPVYKDHRLIYDNVEDGLGMDVGRFFGKSVERRLEPPEIDDGNPMYSSTVEEFQFNFEDACDGDQPFIYVLDSMDALDTEDDEEKFAEQRRAHDKGKTNTTGSYGTSKAKKNSAGMRRIKNRLAGTDNILIVISQTRDNIGFGAQFNPKTVSGGTAIKFYAQVLAWLAKKEDIRASVKGKQRSLGIRSGIKIDKNRFTGRHYRVEVPIYWNHGIDELGSMIEWLVEEGVWKKEGGKINAKELELKGSVDGLVAQIEEKGLEKDLQLVVTEVWDAITEACQIHRKKRYQ